jgi:hypothetical protein
MIEYFIHRVEVTLSSHRRLYIPDVWVKEAVMPQCKASGGKCVGRNIVNSPDGRIRFDNPMAPSSCNGCQTGDYWTNRHPKAQ